MIRHAVRFIRSLISRLFRRRVRIIYIDTGWNVVIRDKSRKP